MSALVVYDGACGFCAGNLKWLNRFDWFGAFSPVPYQDSNLKKLWPAADIQACEKALHLVLENGRVYEGADAFREIFARMPGTFLMGFLMRIPPLPGLFRWIYPYMSRNRYLLGGRCRMQPLQTLVGEAKGEQKRK